jgi:hypothetical protein
LFRYFETQAGETPASFATSFMLEEILSPYSILFLDIARLKDFYA